VAQTRGPNLSRKGLQIGRFGHVLVPRSHEHNEVKALSVPFRPSLAPRRPPEIGGSDELFGELGR
jgi:hypothetical protein